MRHGSHETVGAAIRFAGIVALCLIVPESASAQARPDAEPQQRRVQALRSQAVSFRVLVAHAMERAGKIDEECRPLQRRLRPMRFGTMRMVSQRTVRSPGPGQWVRVKLPTGEVMSFLPINVVQDRVFVHLRLPGRMNTHLRMNRGKPMIFGGPAYKEGHLVVQIVPDF